MTIDFETAMLPRHEHGLCEITQSVAASDELVESLANTRAFQRLKKIRFLGGIDYLKVRSPNGKRGNTRHTRYQHSLGVAKLAQAYCEDRQLPLVDFRLVVAAALLHDLGHAPLSHSLEPVFFEVFGVEHHSATIKIIRGEKLGAEIHDTLQSFRIDIEKLIALISGGDPSYDEFFSGPVSFDTIEGILRSTKYVSKQSAGHQPKSVMSAAMSNGSPQQLKIVDDFWNQKNLVYGRLINSEDGVLADHACQAFMRKNISNIAADDFYSTEQALFKKLPGLRQLLKSADFKSKVWNYLENSILYQTRNFFIEQQSINFRDRYRQRKTAGVLTKPHEQKMKSPKTDQAQQRFI